MSQAFPGALFSKGRGSHVNSKSLKKV